MGAATLYQLARRGVRAIGFDRFTPPHSFGSSHGETRITRQAIGEGAGYVPLVLRSHQIWDELEAATGMRLITRCGFLAIAAADARAEMHGKTGFVETTIAAARLHGIVHELPTAAEAARRFPQFALRGDETCYYEPGGGYVHPEACIAAQLREAQRLGAALQLDTRVQAVVRDGAGVRIETSAGNFHAARAVVAAGAWVGDFAITVAAGVALHFTINIPERQETVLHDLREVAPTFYLAAPRSWDNMLTTIQVRMEDSTPLKKWLYDVFMNSALAAERRKLEGKQPSLKERLMRPLGELLVFGPIKDQLGLTRLRNAFTGGEAIGEDTFVFYRALGVKLRQFYGQTESSAFNALQDIEEVRLHTVGKPLPGVEVKIGDNGEIMVRSGSVFSGYYKLENATREALEDGWLRTGDAGYVEPDGHMVVLGRLSEVVYTSKGERYIPNYIENRLKFSPYIKDVAVLGSGRDTLAAIICIDKEPVGHWAEVRGISYMSYADLSQNPEVIELVTAAVKRVNSILPDGLKLHHFVSLHKEFDPDDGEVTRTRKLRRNVVEQRYAPIIDAIYGGQKTVTMKAQITYESGEVGTIERQLSVQEI
mgnify:CR=1 FL=1